MRYETVQSAHGGGPSGGEPSVPTCRETSSRSSSSGSRSSGDRHVGGLPGERGSRNRPGSVAIRAMRGLSLSDAERFACARVGAATVPDSRCPALRVGSRSCPAEFSNRAYAGVMTGGIPRWRVVRTRRVESGSAWSDNQLHGGGYAQQVSRAAYERRQERTQCRRGGRGDVPRQRSSVDRWCHQDDFPPGPSKASPEVVAHQAPLAPAARRGSAPCADDGDEDERNGPIHDGLAARQ